MILPQVHLRNIFLYQSRFCAHMPLCTSLPNAALSPRHFLLEPPRHRSPFRVDRLNLKQHPTTHTHKVYHYSKYMYMQLSITPSLTVCVPSVFLAMLIKRQLGGGLSISSQHSSLCWPSSCNFLPSNKALPRLLHWAGPLLPHCQPRYCKF